MRENIRIYVKTHTECVKIRENVWKYIFWALDVYVHKRENIQCHFPQSVENIQNKIIDILNLDCTTCDAPHPIQAYPCYVTCVEQ